MRTFVTLIFASIMFKTKFVDVSRWKKEIHINTSGTRNKHILTSNLGETYFFKKSLLKPGKDYKYEFWSEIIASQVGRLLNFDVVIYDVAYFKNEIGCISKSIIDINNEELSEGYGYIVERYPEFKESYKKTHSFQKIIGSLKKLKLEHLINDVIKMIIFDSIIGNTDRHSENWAVVISNKKLNDAIKKISQLSWFNKLKLQFLLLFISKGKFTISKFNNRMRKDICKFSPLYDNGSSLARELDDERMNELLNDNNKFENFMNKGKPDIRWDDKKLNHFELVNTLRMDYPNEVNNIFEVIKSRYSKKILTNIVKNIDKKLPNQFNDYRLSSIRKEFIIKYIDARINIILNNNEQI